MVFLLQIQIFERTVNISSSAYSLTDIQDKINNASLGGKVVMKDKSDFALVLRSNMICKFFKITAVEDLTQD